MNINKIVALVYNDVNYTSRPDYINAYNKTQPCHSMIISVRASSRDFTYDLAKIQLILNRRIPTRTRY